MQHYAIQKVNGKPLQVRTAADGTIEVDTLYQLANIGSNRVLVQQHEDGSNRVVHRGQRITVRPHGSFSDAPLHTRGAC
jgi:hypothetical protein